MIARLRTYFISGLLVLIPVVVTLLVIKFLVDILSKSLLLLPPAFQPDVILGFHLPGVGVAITLGVILLMGFLASNFMGRKMLGIGDMLMSRIPLVRTIYTGVKQVTQTVFTPNGQSFRKVLLVEYPSPGIWSIAFQTGEIFNEVSSHFNNEPLVCYFIPTTPNPTSGFLMIAPKSKVIELDMGVDQALKFVISLGVVQPSGNIVMPTPQQ